MHGHIKDVTRIYDNCLLLNIVLVAEITMALMKHSNFGKCATSVLLGYFSSHKTFIEHI